MHKILLGAIIAAAIMLAYPSLVAPQQSFAETTTNEETDTNSAGAGSCNTSTPTHAGSFLTVDGINGANGSPCFIQIDSWSFGATNAGTDASAAGGAGAGKVKFNDFTIKKTTDSASPLFFKNCVSGQHFPKVTLVVRKAGGTQTEFLKITMSDILVSSFQTGGSGNENPTESISLNFAQVSYEFNPKE